MEKYFEKLGKTSSKLKMGSLVSKRKQTSPETQPREPAEAEAEQPKDPSTSPSVENESKDDPPPDSTVSTPAKIPEIKIDTSPPQVQDDTADEVKDEIPVALTMTPVGKYVGLLMMMILTLTPSASPRVCAKS